MTSPVPALPDTERRTTYAGLTDDVGPFDVDFDLYGNGTDYAQWIEVYLDGELLVAGTDYTLDSPSGTLATLARPISDARITPAGAYAADGFTGDLVIVGADRPRRTAQLTESRGISARDFNQIITHIVARAREMWDKSRRGFYVPFGETGGTLPGAATRAGKVFAFDDSGDPIATEGEAGPQGIQGIQGDPGLDGADGTDPGIRWAFDSSTTMGAPAAGGLRFDNASFASITNIAVNAQCAESGNPDVSEFVATYDDSTNTSIKGTLTIKKVGAPQNFVILNVSGSVTDNTTWLQVGVTYVVGNGSFSAADVLAVQFSRAGNKGSDGLGSGDMAKADYDPDEDGKFTTANLADNAVTDAILRDSAAVSVIGRAANTSGNPGDIAAAANGGILARLSDAVAFSTLSALLDFAIGSTRGMLGVRGASTWGSLGIGSANNVLKSDGTDPGWGSLSSLLDAVIGSTRGMLTKRGASAWESLSIGSANTVLKSDGTDPSYATLTSLLDSVFGSTRGMMLVRGASAWSALAIGTNGKVLQSDGTDPSWQTPSAGGGTTHFGACDGRLSLSTGVFEMSAAVSGATSVFFVPGAIGSQIGLYDGASAWSLITFPEKSVKLTDSQSCTTVDTNTTLTVADSDQLVVGMKISGAGIAANTTISSITDSTHIVMNNAANASGTNTITFKCPADTGYDVYGKNVSGALKLYLKARSAILTKNTHTTQDGVEVLSGDTTMRWLGAVITSGTDGQADWALSGQRRFRVFNAYNKRYRSHAEVFASSGTYHKPMGLVSAILEAAGGGGGGGTGATGGSIGTAGGASSIGSLVSANGGGAGNIPDVNPGPAHGTASGSNGIARTGCGAPGGYSGKLRIGDSSNSGLPGGNGGLYRGTFLPSEIGVTETVTVGAGGTKATNGAGAEYNGTDGATGWCLAIETVSF